MLALYRLTVGSLGTRDEVVVVSAFGAALLRGAAFLAVPDFAVEDFEAVDLGAGDLANWRPFHAIVVRWRLCSKPSDTATSLHNIMFGKRSIFLRNFLNVRLTGARLI